MNTRYKFHYKSGLYFLNFSSNVIQKTVFTDSFESMSTWDRSANNFGHSLTALDTAIKKSGNYSGRIDDNYPRQWSKYVYSDTWTPINNSQDTYYTVSGWVYVEDVTTNGSLPNLAKLWIVTRKQGERGYPTGHISTSSTKEGTWEYLSKTVLIPADVKEINVRIENARLGKVWFDDVKIVKGNTSQTVIVEESNYYPFGLKHKGYNNVVNGVEHLYDYSGKENQKELGLNWHDFGARNYDASSGRWMNPDAMSDSFRSLSPYNYAANNPVLVTDPDGNDISFGFQYEQDKDGNDVVDKNGNRNLIGVTMTVTGKVINTSGKDVNMSGAISEISSQISSSFKGETNGVKFNTVVNLTEAKSMDDVQSSDHVFALSEINTDNVESMYGDKTTVYGASNQFGGKVAFIDVDYFRGAYDTTLGGTGEKTAAHEFGHLANLGHKGGWKNFFNLMLGNGSPGTKVTGKQLSSILRSYSDKKLNKGVNYEIYTYPTNSGWKRVKKPNRGVAKPLIKY